MLVDSLIIYRLLDNDYIVYVSYRGSDIRIVDSIMWEKQALRLIWVTNAKDGPEELVEIDTFCYTHLKLLRIIPKHVRKKTH